MIKTKDIINRTIELHCRPAEFPKQTALCSDFLAEHKPSGSIQYWLYRRKHQQEPRCNIACCLMDFADHKGTDCKACLGKERRTQRSWCNDEKCAFLQNKAPSYLVAIVYTGRRGRCWCRQPTTALCQPSSTGCSASPVHHIFGRRAFSVAGPIGMECGAWRRPKSGAMIQHISPRSQNISVLGALLVFRASQWCFTITRYTNLLLTLTLTLTFDGVSDICLILCHLLQNHDYLKLLVKILVYFYRDLIIWGWFWLTP